MIITHKDITFLLVGLVS